MTRRVRTLVAVAVAGIALAAVPAPAEAATASCYGPGLYGNRMANGERLYPSTIGVAHRWLPFGTRLYVRTNGRTVRVRVTDRGPFVADRSLDLTNGAVQALGYRSCTAFGVRSVRAWRTR